MSSQDIKEAGLRVTAPRIKILDMLQHQRGAHLTVEDIHRALTLSGEEVGIATVYRALAQFEASNLVKRHHFDSGQSIYELNEGDHHDHIVCIQCGRIAEFYDEVIETRQRVAADQLGFTLVRHSLILYGHCAGGKCTAPAGDSLGDAGC